MKIWSLFSKSGYKYYTKHSFHYVKHNVPCISCFLAITVMFNQSMYSVNEDAGPAQPVLVISNPSSTDITVQVTNTDGSATGEYCSILINY